MNTSAHKTKLLTEAVDSFIQAPTGANKERLIHAADEYRESWILAQASRVISAQPASTPQSSTTSYDRALEVTRLVDGIRVTLALQQRTSVNETHPWWVLSWRTKYSPDGPNRRFYLTSDGSWTIPASVALEMIEEMATFGGLDDEYFDTRRRPDFEPIVSSNISAAERAKALATVTGPNEDWGPDPYFVICYDPHADWKKVLIINTRTNTATFRSVTEKADYMPRKVLRPGAGWWLDNSMMDANVQQIRAFREALIAYLNAVA